MKAYRFLAVFCFVVLVLSVVACGKKGDPLPQKVDQLFSLQNVFIVYNPEGTLTVQGSVIGAVANVQAFSLQLEAVDEDCIGCPFVPVEHFSKRPEEIWGGVRSTDFSFTVLPREKSTVYRWRLVAYNAISGLPNVMTPVYKVNKNFEDTRNFVEVK